MFGDQVTKESVQQDAKRILGQRARLDDETVRFQTWLDSQTDADLTSLGFDASDIALLRGAFDDTGASIAITRGKLPPSNYPQPPSTHDYTANSKQVVGPVAW